MIIISKINMEDEGLTKEYLQQLYFGDSKSIREIAEMYSINRSVVKRWLKESGIQINSNKTAQKYTFNKHYFDKIDSKDKAYWMGFIWCDGYVCKRTRKNNESYEFKLSLSSQDEEHLILFNKYLNSNYSIKNYEIKNGFETDNHESRLYISNKYFASVLYNRFGLIPNRSSCNKLLSEIPCEFSKDFIRGIVDAEGCITKCKKSFNNSERDEFSLNISTYEELLVYINKILVKENLTNTYYKITKRHEDKDAYCKKLGITGNNRVFNILTWLYQDTENLSLKRKYNSYVTIKNYMNLYYKEKLNKNYIKRGDM